MADTPREPHAVPANESRLVVAVPCSATVGGSDDDDDERTGGCMCGGAAAPPLHDFATAGRQDGCAAAVCVTCCGARRLGNMVVLWQDPLGEAGAGGGSSALSSALRWGSTRRYERMCMVGPFWPCMVFVTFPLIGGGACAVLFWMFPRTPPLVQAVVLLLTLLVLTALGFTACSNPGLVRRHETKPDTDEGASWIYSNQVNTWRPPGAIYCRDCGTVVEEFDHLCPWTGTAIGAGNMPYFNTFISSLCCMLFVLFGVAIADAMDIW